MEKIGIFGSKKAFAMAVVVIMLAGVIGAAVYINRQENANPADDGFSRLETFSSFDDMKDYLDYKNNMSSGNYYRGGAVGFGGMAVDDMAMGAAENDASAPFKYGGEGSQDHSTTNIQVEGVDEGDIVKNDAGFAYVVSHENDRVFIVDVHPAEQAHIVSVVDAGLYIREIYVIGDRLVVLGSPQNDIYYMYEYDYYYGYRQPDMMTVFVYDIENRDAPALARNASAPGYFTTSRIIGDYLYVIGSQSTWGLDEENMPVPANRTYYIDEYDDDYSLTIILAINIFDDAEAVNQKVILMGSSSNIYMSENNLYITNTKRMSYVEQKELEYEAVWDPIMPPDVKEKVNGVKVSPMPRWEKVDAIDNIVYSHFENVDWEQSGGVYYTYDERYDNFWEKMTEENEKTSIHKISVDGRKIEYITSGEVTGHVLNRYSMDEHDGYFRIATTVGWMMDNRLFVLDDDLNVVGSIVDIAPGERIYSARFLGARAYLVTFKQVDPFFVIDLTDPENPEILGELKIPGFSTYLHPYDENHIIGIGKDTVDAGEFAWFQGVKMSLFDVTDVQNPVEVDKYMIIGDRGTESLALDDPHAFLFSKEKNLIVIPVELYEYEDDDTISPSVYGYYVWNGAYVIDVTADGFDLRGTVTHDTNQTGNEYYYYSYYGPDQVKRSFYIDDVLYTVSGTMLKANDLETLDEIIAVTFPDGA